MPADVFSIGPYVVPGVLQRVEVPERKLVWQVTQGALGGLGAATIWRGVQITEGIVLTTLITDPVNPSSVVTSAEAAAALWGAFLDQIHPNPIAKPPAWDVGHPFLDAQRPRIQRCAHSTNKLASYKDGGWAAYVGSLVLLEFRPFKPVAPAAPDPAKLDSGVKPPQDAAEQQIQDLLSQVQNG